MAFLTRGLRIELTDERAGGEKADFQYEGGIADFIRYVNDGKDPIHKDVVYFESETDEGQLEVAMQWNGSYVESTYSFANNINTHEGGTHLSGFKASLTRTLNDYARAKGLLKEKEEPLTGDDCREGLAAIVSVKLREPQFEGQTKTKLGNPSIRGLVETSLQRQARRVPRGAPGRGAGDRQQADRRQPGPPGGAQGARPDPPQDRAGRRRPAGQAGRLLRPRSARCRALPGRGRLRRRERRRRPRPPSFQAILPLRGKIINVEKARINKVLSNNEIQAMITAIGTGIGEEFKIEGARYHKVVVTCDADVDGAHIRTLILTFLFRHMKELIEAGYVYIAQPPLYKLKRRLRRPLLREGAPARGVADPRAAAPRSRSPTATATEVRLTETRLQRLQRAVKEYEGWASKLKELYGAAAVSYVKDHRLIEQPIASLADLEAYFASRGARRRAAPVEVMGSSDDGASRCASSRRPPARRARCPSRWPSSTAPATAACRPRTRGWSRSSARRRSRCRWASSRRPCTRTRRCGPPSSRWPRRALNLQRFKGLGEMNPSSSGRRP